MTSHLGQSAGDAAAPPPPLVALIAASIAGAIVAVWTVNRLAAFGEEYGWRGLMWDELKHHGPLRANLVIGLVWGDWHAPLIIQGYNYPGEQPLLGVLTMVIFWVAMSPLLTAIRAFTGSVLPVAAAHGIFNAIAVLLLFLAPSADLIIGGPLGLLGSALLLLVGVSTWVWIANRFPRETDEVVAAGPMVHPFTG